MINSVCLLYFHHKAFINNYFIILYLIWVNILVKRTAQLNKNGKFFYSQLMKWNPSIKATQDDGLSKEVACH